jgi:hypothetical protein
MDGKMARSQGSHNTKDTAALGCIEIRPSVTIHRLYVSYQDEAFGNATLNNASDSSNRFGNLPERTAQTTHTDLPSPRDYYLRVTSVPSAGNGAMDSSESSDVHEDCHINPMIRELLACTRQPCNFLTIQLSHTLGWG